MQVCLIFMAMIKVAIDKSLLASEGQKAAFGIVKNAVEKSLKKFEKEIAEEGGSVVVTITGPGKFDVSMDKLSLKLRRKISSASKKMFA
jgi:DNA-binding protein YbaB